jgi:hypothetical protein
MWVNFPIKTDHPGGGNTGVVNALTATSDQGALNGAISFYPKQR